EAMLAEASQFIGTDQQWRANLAFHAIGQAFAKKNGLKTHPGMLYLANLGGVIRGVCRSKKLTESSAANYLMALEGAFKIYDTPVKFDPIPMAAEFYSGSWLRKGAITCKLLALNRQRNEKEMNSEIAALAPEIAKYVEGHYDDLGERGTVAKKAIDLYLRNSVILDAEGMESRKEQLFGVIALMGEKRLAREGYSNQSQEDALVD